MFQSECSQFFGNGITETFFSGLSTLVAFAGFSHLYLLMPLLEKTEDFKKIAVISTILSSICLFISVVTLLLSFPFILSSDELLSIFLITRLAEYGTFLQSAEALIVFFWFLSLLSYLSITLYLILRIFQKLTNIKNRSAMSYCFCAIFYSITLLIRNITQIKFFQREIFKYTTIFLVFLFSGIILFLAYMKKLKNDKSKKNTGGSI